MMVAAGCPFRRVITLFPSMTHGDTTVTSHLPQTPEDTRRHTEKKQQTFIENKREKININQHRKSS